MAFSTFVTKIEKEHLLGTALPLAPCKFLLPKEGIWKEGLL